MKLLPNVGGQIALDRVENGFLNRVVKENDNFILVSFKGMRQQLIVCRMLFPFLCKFTPRVTQFFFCIRLVFLNNFSG